MKESRFCKFIIFLFFTFYIISCNSTREIRDSNKVEELENNNLEDLEIATSQKMNFTCKNEEYNIDLVKVSRINFPRDLRECLLEEGFNGNLDANIQIVLLINHLNDLSVFGLNPKFRGKEVFEAILPLCDNHNATKNFDGEIDGSTYGLAYFSYCSEMINSVDGLPISEYVDNKLREKFSLENYIEIAIEVPRIVYSQELFLILNSAWRKGKITLKDFKEN